MISRHTLLVARAAVQLQRGTIVRLEEWDVVRSRYAAPETGFHLRGKVFGHPNPRHYDGKMVMTSTVVSAKGKTVRTEHGVTYRLGEPCPKYKAWLEADSPDVDWENPIRIGNG